MGNKGSNTTTTTSSANPMAMQAYSDLLARAAGVASRPYQAYTGQEVAPINAQQQAGFGNINNAASLAGNNVTAASNYLTNNLNGVTPSDVAQWYNPYESQVVDATQAQFDHDNAVQQSQVTGNAAAQNALGGDRTAVAAALTAEGQKRAQSPVIAGLKQAGYNNAVENAFRQKAQGNQSASQLAGVANNYLPTAQAQVGAGTLEQQTEQARDTAAFQDYLRAQGFPYQQAQWLAGIQTGVGSNLGGTSTSQGPTPNPWSQIAGLGLSAAMMFANRGGRIKGFASGGNVMPYSGAQSYIPDAMPIHHGSLPQASSAPKQAGLSMKDWGNLGAAANKWWNSEDDAGSKSVVSPDDFTGGTQDMHSIYRSGGRVGYADGGSPSLTGGSLPWLDDQVEADKWYAPTTAGFGASRPAADLSFEDRWVEPPKDFTREGAIKRNLLQGAGTVSDSPAVQERLQAGLLEPPERLPEEREASTAPLPRPRPAGLAPQDDGVGEINTALGDQGDEDPSQAMAYDGGAPPPRQGGFTAPPPAPPLQGPAEAAGETSGIGGILQRLGFKMSPELRQGLLQAGLGMMAAGHGGPGSFLQNLGEGGAYGVQGYNASLVQQRRDRLEQNQQARQARQDQLAREQFERPYQQLTKAQQATIDREFKPTYGVIREEVDQETGFTKKVYGWIDPNKKTTTPDTTGGAPAAAAPKPAAEPNVQQQGVIGANNQQVATGTNYSKGAPYVEKGMDVPEPTAVGNKSTQSLKTDAENYLTTGKLPPVRGGKSPVAIMQQQYQDAVKNYGNAVAQSRGLTPQQVAEMWRTAPGMLRFILGADGRSTIALGTAVRHLDTVAELAKAWQANDTQALNRIRASLARQFGSAAGTDLEAAGAIVGPEIIKAIGVAGAGTKEEREKVEQMYSTARSPAQIAGAVIATQKLLAGQLEGKRRQAAAVGVDENRFKGLVGDRPYQILSELEGGGHGAPATKQLSPIDKQALDWANDPTNASDPRAVAIKKRLGVQ